MVKTLTDMWSVSNQAILDIQTAEDRRAFGAMTSIPGCFEMGATAAFANPAAFVSPPKSYVDALTCGMNVINPPKMGDFYMDADGDGFVYDGKTWMQFVGPTRQQTMPVKPTPEPEPEPELIEMDTLAILRLKVQNFVLQEAL
jgi:hypothetical protein